MAATLDRRAVLTALQASALLTAFESVAPEARSATAQQRIAGLAVRPRVIFDTDFAVDSDDTADLALLIAFHKLGLISLVGVCMSGITAVQIQAVRSCLSYAQMPGIPVWGTGTGSLGGPGNWGGPVGLLFGSFSSTADNIVTGYRKILAQQPNGSVVIIMAGGGGGMAALLQSTADVYGPAGPQLISAKVAWCGWEAGFFPNHYAPQNSVGVKTLASGNLGYSATVGQTLISLWPADVPFNWCGDEQGGGTSGCPTGTIPSISPYMCAQVVRAGNLTGQSGGYVQPLIMLAAGFNNWWQVGSAGGGVVVSQASTPNVTMPSGAGNTCTLNSGTIYLGQYLTGTGVAAQCFINSINGGQNPTATGTGTFTVTANPASTLTAFTATGNAGFTAWYPLVGGPHRYISSVTRAAAAITSQTAFFGKMVSVISAGPSDNQPSNYFTGGLTPTVMLDFGGGAGGSTITGSGSTWQASDLSGNSNYAFVPSAADDTGVAPPTITAAALNGLSVATFDGSSMMLGFGGASESTLAASLNNGGTITPGTGVSYYMITLVKFASVTAEGHIADIGPVYNTQAANVMRAYMAQKAAGGFNSGRIGASNLQPNAPPTLAISTWYLLESWYDASIAATSGLRNGWTYNGIGPMLATNGTVNTTLNLTTCRLMGSEYASGGSNHFFVNGQMAFYALFANALPTLAQRRSLYRGITDRWGNLNLPY